MESGLMHTLYDSPIPEIDELGMLRIQKASDPMRPEVHEHAFELLYVQSGEKRFTVDDTEYILYGGDLLVIHPSEEHGNWQAMQNRSFLYYLLLKDPCMCRSFLQLNSETRLNLSNRLNALRQIHLSTNAKELYRRIFASAEKTDPLAAARVSALLLLLLDELCGEHADPRHEIPQDIRRVLDYVEQHDGEMPDVLRLAGVAGLSEPHFKQKFKRCLGVPPAEYIARVQVARAEERLKQSNDNITRIAEKLGFSSAQHFSKVFQRYRGISPTEYRRRYQADIHPDTSTAKGEKNR